MLEEVGDGSGDLRGSNRSTKFAFSTALFLSAEALVSDGVVSHGKDVMLSSKGRLLQ